MLVLTLSFSSAYGAPQDSTNSNNDGLVCIFSVPSGSTVLEQNAVQTIVAYPDGIVHHFYTQNCPVRGYPFTINTNIEWVYNTLSSGKFTNLEEQWTVAKEPTVKDSQLVALWMGLEGPTYVFQPVLVWGCQNPICTVGGQYWWIAAENCSSSCTISSVVRVSVTNNIDGRVYDTGLKCIGGVAERYGIVAKDISTGASTILMVCTTDNLQYADLGVLEAKNLNYCFQLPQGSGVGATFSLSYETPSGGPWYDVNTNPSSPNCSWGVSHLQPVASYLYWNSGT